MIRHVVLLALKADTPPAERDRIVEELRALPRQIPGIEAYEVGVGLNPGNASVAIVALFSDDQAFQEYRRHPVHRALAQDLLIPATESSATAQFEC